MNIYMERETERGKERDREEERERLIGFIDSILIEFKIVPSEEI